MKVKLKIFSICDVKAGAFLAPFFQRSSAEALRSFETAVNDPQSTFSRYPTDFTLFELGEFDDASATITLHEAKRPLAGALELVKRSEAPLPLFNQPRNEVQNQAVSR